MSFLCCSNFQFSYSYSSVAKSSLSPTSSQRVESLHSVPTNQPCCTILPPVHSKSTNYNHQHFQWCSARRKKINSARRKTTKIDAIKSTEYLAWCTLIKNHSWACLLWYRLAFRTCNKHIFQGHPIILMSPNIFIFPQASKEGWVLLKCFKLGMFPLQVKDLAV